MINKIKGTNRNTVPGDGVDKNIYVKAGDFNPLVDAVNKATTDISELKDSELIVGAHELTPNTVALSTVYEYFDTGIAGINENSLVVASITSYQGSGFPIITSCKILPNLKLEFGIANLHATSALDSGVYVNYIVKV